MSKLAKARKPRLQGLRIDFEVGGLMVVPDRHPVALDALLLAQSGERLPLPFTPEVLPLQTVSSEAWPENAAFVWLASNLEVDWVGPGSDRYLSRNAKTHEILDDKVIHGGSAADSSGGLSKLARKRFMIRHADMARAWCVGDIAAIQDMACRVTSIGAQRHLGFGVVRRCEVVVDAAAYELAWRRPLPGAHAEDPFKNARFQAPGRASPPYWDRDLSLQAWWPVSLLGVAL